METRTHTEIEDHITMLRDELQTHIKNQGIVGQLMNDLRRKKLQLQADITNVNIELNGLTGSNNKARENVKRTELEIKSETTAFWAAKNEGQ